MKKRILSIAVCMLPLLSFGQQSYAHFEANVAGIPANSVLTQEITRPKVVLTQEGYNQMKLDGALNPNVDYVFIEDSNNQPVHIPVTKEHLDRMNYAHNEKTLSTQCDCLVPLDGSFSVAEFVGGSPPDYRNDDLSTAAKALPFTFCMYGTNYNQIFINNNGNITFGAGYGPYTSFSFPSNTIPAMVAPFWADVMTTNAGSGLVYYKITPTYAIVKWQAVGYFNNHADKVNTFQLIITDGSDPIIANGANIAFCYGDMQWTTGDVSGGVNGFGGTPATVGVNKGDGINFAQVGRFDQPGSAYNGTTLASGVSWLDNQSFFFNTCSISNNISPIAAGLNNCDTLHVCGANDSLILSALFLSPELGQNTVINVNLNGTQNASVIVNVSGNVAFAQVLIYASSLNYGNNQITFTATDNGVPAGITTVISNVYIDSSTVSSLNPSITGTLGMCQGSATTLSVTPTTYDSYLWSTGSNNTSITVTNPGQYWVTSTLNGCHKTNLVTVASTPAAYFSYVGTPYCQNAANPSPTFSANAAAGTFTSTPGLVINSSTGVVNLSASTPGTYTVTNTVPAQSGCPAVSATSTITITAVQVATFSYVGGPFCQVGGVNPAPSYSGGAFGGTFTSVPAGLSINAATGVVNASLTSPGTYTVTNTIPAANGCPAATATATITIMPAAVASFTYLGSPYCKTGTNPSPTYFGGGIAGTFTATPAGLVIVAGSGTVNLSASAAGTYSVTNTLPAMGPCPAQTYTATITITAPPVGTFSFTGSPYCHGGSVNPLPTFSGAGVGGTFTASPVGLVINPTTGLVNLTTSSVGTYTVTNTLPAANGCPAVLATATITIVPGAIATFSYLGDPYCQGAGNPLPTFSGGGIGGVFSGDPGLVITPGSGLVDLSATPAGTYNVTNTLPPMNGCASVSYSTTISITELPSGTFDYPGNPFCQTAGIVSANFIGIGQPGIFSSSSLNLVVDPNSADIDISSSQPGTYWVYNLLPASDGCPDVLDSTQVTITSAPVATFGYVNTPYCQNGSNPTPTFNSGGIGGVFSSTPGLVINPATGLVDLVSSTAGTYTVTNTVSPTGCPSVASTSTITIDAVADAAFSYTGTPYCVGGANPSPTLGSGAIAGTFSSTLGLSIDASTGVVNLALTTPGTYTVTNTIAAVGACPAVTATATITVATAFAASFNYSGTPYCQNAGNPSPNFTGGGVAGAFTSTSGLTIDGTTGIVNLALSTPGTYTVTNTIAASGGCPLVAATTTITITAEPIATFSYTGTPYCTGAANPGPTFGPGGVAGTFTSTLGLIINPSTGVVDLGSSTPGTYVITNTIASAGGCPVVTATSSITINTMAVATYMYTGNPYCQNASNPVPSYSGGGSAGNFTSTTGLVIDAATGIVDLASSTPGTYIVTNSIAAVGGCAAASDTGLVVIVALPVTNFSYTGTPYCQGGTNPLPTFNGGGTAGTFSSTAGLIINPSTGLIDLASSTPGNYTVTNQIFSAACGTITSTASVSIVGTFVASFNYAGTPYCQNGIDPSPTFVNSGVAGTFTSTSGLVINPSTGLVTLASSTPGTYMVVNTITTVGCPSAIDSSTITIAAPVFGNFSYTGSPYCQGAGTASVTYSGLGVAGTFTSTPGLIINSTTGDVDLLTSIAGTYTVTNTVSAAAGCSPAVATSTITIGLAPVSTFSYLGTPYCQNAPNPNPTYSGGGVAGNFTFSPGGLSINPTTGTVNLMGSTPGTYTVTNVVTASGCPAATSSASISITAPGVATFSYTGSPFCQNVTNPLPTLGAGATAGTYTATGGLPINSVTGEVNMATALPGTYTITNTLAALGGCPQISASTSIIVNGIQNATFAYGASTYCTSSSPVSPSNVVTAGGTFSSTIGLTISSSGTITPSSSTAGTYVVTYTTPGPCASTSTQTVTVNASPVANAGSTQTLSCGAGTVTLSGTSPCSTCTYNWTGGTIVSGGTTLTPVVSATGTYTLTVTDNSSAACSSTSTVVVNSTPAPTSSFTANPTSGTPPLIVNFTNTSSNSTNYIWSFPGGDPANYFGSNPPPVTYSTTGAYSVILYAYNGACVDSTIETILVHDGYTMLIPNVFSPNGDGINDFFTLISTGVTSFSGAIYDRWGLKMYEWSDVTKGWDGHNKSGGLAQDGTYYYIITSAGYGSTEHTDQGFFLLTR